MKTIVITGATSGIGLETTRLLACRGFSIIATGRDAGRCEAARDSILASAPDAAVRFYPANLMRQRDALDLCVRIREDLNRTSAGCLHALINNAGCAKSWYTTTVDGLEQQFALNYLAGFLLTYGLFPALSRAGGRVIMTASQSHKGAHVHWDDLMLTRRYNPLTAYKQSKLCDVLFARALNDRYAALGIRAYAVDPGLARTEIGNKAGGVVGLVWSLRKRHGIPPSVSAEAFARLCIPAHHPAGLYHDRRGEKAFSRQVTAENAARLFSVSERLCGITYQEAKV